MRVFAFLIAVYFLSATTIVIADINVKKACIEIGTKVSSVSINVENLRRLTLLKASSLLHVLSRSP